MKFSSFKKAITGLSLLLLLNCSAANAVKRSIDTVIDDVLIVYQNEPEMQKELKRFLASLIATFKSLEDDSNKSVWCDIVDLLEAQIKAFHAKFIAPLENEPMAYRTAAERETITHMKEMYKEYLEIVACMRKYQRSDNMNAGIATMEAAKLTNELMGYKHLKPKAIPNRNPATALQKLAKRLQRQK